MDRLILQLKDMKVPGHNMKRRHDAVKEAVTVASTAATQRLKLQESSSSGLGMPPEPHTIPIIDLTDDDGKGSLWSLVFTIFPDICPDYVEKMYKKQKKKKRLETNPDSNVLIHSILEAGAYPTIQERKRRKINNDTNKKQPHMWGINDGIKRDRRYFDSARALLHIDYPHIPVDFLRNVLCANGVLFDAYLELADMDTDYDRTVPPPYERIPGQRTKRGEIPPFETVHISRAHRKNLISEFQDARAARTQKKEKKRQEAEAERLEEENTAIHAATGGLIECGCCFTETALNRLVCCAGAEAHFFCASCIKSNVKTQIGYMRYEIDCMDMSQCNAGFSRATLAEVLDDSLLKKLDELRQRDDIVKAGLDGLEECPFCEFKAIYPPIEENREFRCLNSNCERVSCRSCKSVSHIPKTCEETRKEAHNSALHQIEEAMSEAVIRNCPNPKCNTPIIKDDGCNKMYCTKCGSIMCYICKQDITKIGYDHFQNPKNSCPLHDHDIDSRHYQEASRAKKTATKQALKSNPNLRAADIKVELPDKAPLTSHYLRGPRRYQAMPVIPNDPQLYNNYDIPEARFQLDLPEPPALLIPRLPALQPNIVVQPNNNILTSPRGIQHQLPLQLLEAQNLHRHSIAAPIPPLHPTPPAFPEINSGPVPVFNPNYRIHPPQAFLQQGVPHLYHNAYPLQSHPPNHTQPTYEPAMNFHNQDY
ncbi:hypothetical protein LOZ53_004148 [Ophidiomyces ophidiicola]|nr:hypothetical protein LOZ55_005552 [Ophidiomyces ophidiicola]KAI1987780.1 hypothetical protein LOZ53_004148 [Ophidiomyces ophidiicola]KAI1989462.1 hypothetical protein LOZ54_002872 [Ophidiomyces ophidiicola]KAI1990554.1 hypothetical protein LOZ51_004905 [Ophidiomyces ophidiicola]